MTVKPLKLAACLAWALSTAACSTVAPRTDVSGAGTVSVAEAGDLSPLADARVGSVARLAAGNPLGARDVRIINEYQAASGRQCRRVQAQSGGVAAGAVRVICQQDNGQWRLTRQLVSTSLIPPATDDNTIEIAASYAADPADPVSPAVPANLADPADLAKVSATELEPAVEHPLQAGETLWSFARRTTGNATNWSLIAQYNDVSDSALIASGTRLRIPPELNKGGH